MDIKLRAKLSAYSLVDTFEPEDVEHACKMMTPVTKEQIDKYLFSEQPPELPDDTTSDAKFLDFVDSLFKEE